MYSGGPRLEVQFQAARRARGSIHDCIHHARGPGRGVRVLRHRGLLRYPFLHAPRPVRVTPRHVRLGAPVHVTGRLPSSAAGTTVELQSARSAHGRWRRVARTRVGARGGYSLHAAPAALGAVAGGLALGRVRPDGGRRPRGALAGGAAGPRTAAHPPLGRRPDRRRTGEGGGACRPPRPRRGRRARRLGRRPAAARRGRAQRRRPASRTPRVAHCRPRARRRTRWLRGALPARRGRARHAARRVRRRSGQRPRDRGRRRAFSVYEPVPRVLV